MSHSIGHLPMSEVSSKYNAMKPATVARAVGMAISANSKPINRSNTRNRINRFSKVSLEDFFSDIINMVRRFDAKLDQSYHIAYFNIMTSVILQCDDYQVN